MYVLCVLFSFLLQMGMDRKFRGTGSACCWCCACNTERDQRTNDAEKRGQELGASCQTIDTVSVVNFVRIGSYIDICCYCNWYVIQANI